jgi:general secretion pathway protein D
LIIPQIKKNYFVNIGPINDYKTAITLQRKLIVDAQTKTVTKSATITTSNTTTVHSTESTAPAQHQNTPTIVKEELKETVNDSVVEETAKRSSEKKNYGI